MICPRCLENGLTSRMLASNTRSIKAQVLVDGKWVWQTVARVRRTRTCVKCGFKKYTVES
jgi:hypothetical protein